MEEKKTDIKPVIAGEASIRKKGEVKKAAESFIVEDAKTVGSELLQNIVVPSIKRSISELVKTAIDMFLYGKSEKPASSSVRTYSNPSYRRAYDRVEPVETPKKIARNTLDYDEILYDTYEDADEVRLSLIDTIERTGVATVAELYEFSKLKTDNYTYNRWGWASLVGSNVKAVYDNGERKYMIKLPKPVPIDWVD